MGWAREAVAQRRPLSVGVRANAVELLEALLTADVPTDVVTDLTAAHDLRYGYVPVGVSSAEAAGLRESDPERLTALGGPAVVRHVRAMLEHRPPRRGRLRLRQQHPPSGRGSRAVRSARARCLHHALPAADVRARIGPFAGSALSGEPADQAFLDRLCEESFPDVARITEWIALARVHVRDQGLPARIAWLGHRSGRASPSPPTPPCATAVSEDLSPSPATTWTRPA
jgi:urocanate hydratase